MNQRTTQLSSPSGGFWSFINPLDLPFVQGKIFRYARVNQRVGVCYEGVDNPYSYLAVAEPGDFIVESDDKEFFVVRQADKDSLV